MGEIESCMRFKRLQRFDSKGLSYYGLAAEVVAFYHTIIDGSYHTHTAYAKILAVVIARSLTQGQFLCSELIQTLTVNVRQHSSGVTGQRGLPEDLGDTVEQPGQPVPAVHQQAGRGAEQSPMEACEILLFTVQ